MNVKDAVFRSLEYGIDLKTSSKEEEEEVKSDLV